MKNKPLIIVGGGYSVLEGIDKDLWEKIKDKEIWSLNYSAMYMPYLPKREIWTDIDFFRNNARELQSLNKKGVECYAKAHVYYNTIPEIHQINCTREKNNKLDVYIGEYGFVGLLGLSLAIKEGYSEIYLLGYDFGCQAKDIDKKLTHWYQRYNFDKYSTGVGAPHVYLLKDNKVHRSVKDFNVYESYKNIYNVSQVSNINSFTKISYDKMFNKIKL